MKVLDLLRDVSYTHTDDDVLEREAKRIVTDHRKVKKGDVFIALQGNRIDANRFIQKALISGASAVVSDEVEGEDIIKVDNARSAYALMSKNYFGRACDSMRIIAVTGTNGKTTTSTALCDVLTSAGYKVGLIGTLGARIGGEYEDTGMTTPDPYKLHSLFAKMKEAGDEFVVMEASAHALALNKLDGIKFEIGVLTNITQDHLDFFDTMENYAEAKYKLFERGRVGLGIVCKNNDQYTDYLLRHAKVPILTYGFNKDCDFKIEVQKDDINGCEFRCKYKDEDINVKSGLVGAYNIENLTAVVSVLRNMKINKYDMLKGIEKLKPAEGRFNLIKWKNLNIIIDFAHTPDGLEKVLSTARSIVPGRLVCIFGCGGNRDRTKRPLMGRIATSLADDVIITSDNPRFENPNYILNDIREGAYDNCKIITDRRQAIEYALGHYKNDETIVIAGKGGEHYQEIGDKKYPYSDFDVVNEYIKKHSKTVSENEGEEEYKH